jgi:hypothetical protein
MYEDLAAMKKENKYVIQRSMKLNIIITILFFHSRIFGQIHYRGPYIHKAIVRADSTGMYTPGPFSLLLPLHCQVMNDNV